MEGVTYGRANEIGALHENREPNARPRVRSSRGKTSSRPACSTLNFPIYPESLISEIVTVVGDVF